MSEQNNQIQSASNSDPCPIVVPCQVTGRTQPQFPDQPVTPVTPATNPIVKIPVVLAETSVQIVVEADIPLTPAASEIKRVLKDAFLTQCKLVPVEFEAEPVTGTTDLFRATRGKLLLEGFIRKNIEYATADCNGTLRDRIANIQFSGFADLAGDVLTGGDFQAFPVFALSSENRARFINPTNGSLPRLDKYLFGNTVNYNEQPYCELVTANFIELDFSPCPTDLNQTFNTLREKIVLDLTLKVLQVQQVQI
ncbi:hypothetical protein H1Z61_12940 [Bacillus aquiflavi]|uniref:DUF7852 domain-containing protein n=1 Tax=Bacillus aquiflavi TaxID=2672567 RepID=A0A6B3W318_9BACI|nr:hypothetical protein [Bacillus aquiflavi]MBA4538015.1 hypothetical protein [Bacillus aquiflavi]NEY82271.1 hypothetical protein [Bacillus aquiflavi]UAC48818.1 hypothetical protein K6959_02350 [Bacillus aquiflavi]